MAFHSRYRSYCTINDNEVKISIAFIDQFLPQKPVYNIHDVRGVGHNGSTVGSELEDSAPLILKTATWQKIWYAFIHSSISKPDQSYGVLERTRGIRSIKKSDASNFSTWIPDTFLDPLLPSRFHFPSNTMSTVQSTVTSFFNIANCSYTSFSLQVTISMSTSFYLKNNTFQSLQNLINLLFWILR